MNSEMEAAEHSVLQRDLIRSIAHKIYDLLADPTLRSRHVDALSRLDLSDASARHPQAFWLTLSYSMPGHVFAGSLDLMNWAAVIKIVAIFVQSKVPRSQALTIENALRSAGIESIELQYPADSQTKKQLRAMLVDCAQTMAGKGISFSIEDAAELLIA